MEETKPKRKVVISTTEVKKEIAKHESGTCLTDLATMFKIPSHLTLQKTVHQVNVSKVL